MRKAPPDAVRKARALSRKTISLSRAVLSEVQAEARRTARKHRYDGMLLGDYSSADRLAILVEEVGEIAKALTYDSGATADDLYAEVIQTAAMAASWAEYIKRLKAQRRRLLGIRRAVRQGKRSRKAGSKPSH